MKSPRKKPSICRIKHNSYALSVRILCNTTAAPHVSTVKSVHAVWLILTKACTVCVMDLVSSNNCIISITKVKKYNLKHVKSSCAGENVETEYFARLQRKQYIYSEDNLHDLHIFQSERFVSDYSVGDGKCKKKKLTLCAYLLINSPNSCDSGDKGR